MAITADFMITADMFCLQGLALQRNVDRHQLESTYSSRTQQLTEALDHEVGTKKKEVGQFMWHDQHKHNPKSYSA